MYIIVIITKYLWTTNCGYMDQQDSNCPPHAYNLLGKQTWNNYNCYLICFTLLLFLLFSSFLSFFLICSWFICLRLSSISTFAFSRLRIRTTATIHLQQGKTRGSSGDRTKYSWGHCKNFSFKILLSRIIPVGRGKGRWVNTVKSVLGFKTNRNTHTLLTLDLVTFAFIPTVLLAITYFLNLSKQHKMYNIKQKIIYWDFTIITRLLLLLLLSRFSRVRLSIQFPKSVTFLFLLNTPPYIYEVHPKSAIIRTYIYGEHPKSIVY